MDYKEKQLDIILATNPAEDDEHTWIRSIEDILTFEEAMDSDGYEGYENYAPDYTRTDAKAALKSGLIRVYSSKEIILGNFVSASEMDAQSYSADGTVNSQYVDIRDVAWIDALQGQYAPANSIVDGYNPMPANREVRPWQIPISKYQMDYLSQNPIIESEGGKWILFHRPQHLIIFDRQTGDCMIDALYMTDEEQGSALIPQSTGNMDRPEEMNKAMDFLLDRIERVHGMNHN